MIKRFFDAGRITPISSRGNRSAIGDVEQSGLGAVRFGESPAPIPAPLVRGPEMRVAETRAVNRALRKAYGIGICSVHYRTKGKAFGSLFIENPPRVSLRTTCN
jgi:hypothetical protein